MNWPDPNATRADIDDFVRVNEPEPKPEAAPWGMADLGGGTMVPHEAPPIENGPSVVCAACGIVRIKILGAPFCKTCRSMMPGEP